MKALLKPVIALCSLALLFVQGQAGAQALASPVVCDVEVGGKLIHFPAPSGFVRVDGVFADWDEMSNAGISASNRGIINFGSKSCLADLKNKQIPSDVTMFSCHVTRSVEAVDVSERYFEDCRNKLKKTWNRAGDKLSTKNAPTLDHANSVIQQKLGEDAVVKVTDAAVLGCFDDSPNSFGGSVAKNIQSAAMAKHKVVASYLLVLVNGRLLHLYGSANYNTDADVKWVETAMLAWRDQLLAANKPPKRAAFDPKIFSNVWLAGLVGGVAGGFIVLVRALTGRLAA